MKFKEITVNTTTEGSDLVAMTLYDNGSEGVSIFDSSDILDLIKSDIIWDYIEENLLVNNKIVKVKGYFNQENFENVYHKIADELAEIKSNSPFDLGSLELIVADIDDQDWVNEWKKYYKPIHIGDIVIVPNWIKYTAQPNEKIVYMDPGMAFGTGEHESTRLCLKLLSELDVQGKTVLDIGTGSGILGIASSVCGADTVYMSDIDAVAVKSAKVNAKLNNLKGNVIIENGDLVANAKIKGDIVFANITADILITLSKQLENCIKEGGYIILSGIIKVRYEEVLNAFLACGYTLDKTLIDGEWCGIRLVK